MAFRKYSPRREVTTGEKFAFLTVTSLPFHKWAWGQNIRYCLAKCVCGVEREFRLVPLFNGQQQSCGCMRSGPRTISGYGHYEGKHGGYLSRLYSCWEGMHARCGNPKNKKYARYGERGISITPEWHEFAPFRDWSAENGYADNLTLDRIDTDGNYEPSNCQWLSRSEHGRKTARDQKLKIEQLAYV